MTELTISVSPRLLLRPRPLPDEWIGSWIVRLAAANYADLSGNLLEFLKTLGIDSIEQQLTDKQIINLSTMAAVDITTLHIMNTLPTDLIQQIGHTRSSIPLPTPFLGVRYFVVCPMCLNEDDVPYFRLTWLSWSTIACTTHGGPLYDVCPHCDSRLCIRLSSALKRKKRRLPQGHEHRVSADLRRCWNCNGDIAIQVTQLTNLSTAFKSLPYQMIREEEIGLDIWLSFIQELRSIIKNYELEHMIDPNFNKPQLLHRYDWRGSMDVSARFHVEQVLTWLMTFPEDQLLRLDQRLEYIGTILLALVIRNEKDYRRTSVRELHVAWLGLRLINDTSHTVMHDWNIYTSVLVSLFEGKCNDPRPKVDSNFEVHQELWQMIILSIDIEFLKAIPGINLPTLPEMREALGHTLQIIAGVPRSKMPSSHMSRVRLGNLVNMFKKHENISPILQQIYFLVLQHRTFLLSPEVTEPVWVESALSILMSDGCISFTMNACPLLHRKLLSGLVYGVKL